VWPALPPGGAGSGGEQAGARDADLVEQESCVLVSCGKDGVILARPAMWGAGPGSDEGGDGAGAAVKLCPLLHVRAGDESADAGVGARGKVSEFGLSPDGTVCVYMCVYVCVCVNVMCAYVYIARTSARAHTHTMQAGDL